VNRNKRGMALDLRQPEGRKLLLRLLAGADVLIENFKPGMLEKWGLGFDVLHERFPRLVHCRISGFGADGLRVQNRNSLREALETAFVRGFAAAALLSISLGAQAAGLPGTMTWTSYDIGVAVIEQPVRGHRPPVVGDRMAPSARRTCGARRLPIAGLAAT
jgi:hypothetical protein